MKKENKKVVKSPKIVKAKTDSKSKKALDAATLAGAIGSYGALHGMATSEDNVVKHAHLAHVENINPGLAEAQRDMLNKGYRVTGARKREILNRIKETGGYKGNEKNLKKFIKTVEESGKTLSPKQEALLKETKEVAKNLGRYRKSKKLLIGSGSVALASAAGAKYIDKKNKH